jgi:hypothetical protein
MTEKKAIANDMPKRGVMSAPNIGRRLHDHSRAS